MEGEKDTAVFWDVSKGIPCNRDTMGKVTLATAARPAPPSVFPVEFVTVVYLIFFVHERQPWGIRVADQMIGA